MILIDDPGQLPSVAGELVYHSKPSNAIGEQGYQTYRMFDTVIKPTINQRVQDDCIKQEKIRNLSLRFRKGESNLDEWKWLLTRDPSNVTNISEFNNAIGLFYNHNKVATYTQEQLTKLQQFVAHINARHSSTVAKSMTANVRSRTRCVLN